MNQCKHEKWKIGMDPYGIHVQANCIECQATGELHGETKEVDSDGIFKEFNIVKIKWEEATNSSDHR